MLYQVIQEYCKLKNIKIHKANKETLFLRKGNNKISTLKIDLISKTINIETQEHTTIKEFDEYIKELRETIEIDRLLLRFSRTATPRKWRKHQHRNSITERGKDYIVSKAKLNNIKFIGKNE